jgi:hypothetical protein
MLILTTERISIGSLASAHASGRPTGYDATTDWDVYGPNGQQKRCHRRHDDLPMTADNPFSRRSDYAVGQNLRSRF